ncbi:hypothetical protein CBM2592_B70049 [Cupriavidus taiwanensis]|nr:hypothetical protein CBM2588_B50049 [Cupriavidus taiwanensis]SOY72546.1 hypothetical protein CBM2592_B70049 [Cupriavidus taiwanensis]SOY96276.1 hypothetical protein CBM2591_B40084 [Cupriavidus taiwanensis]SOZ89200.1 hypothetical protein CBM2618_B80049 [Cupriavidus taiwanensis]SOZ92098.1 hypothetical protein CBM2622_B80049 [Cupriavidus taiwanensis]
MASSSRPAPSKACSVSRARRWRGGCRIEGVSIRGKEALAGKLEGVADMVIFPYSNSDSNSKIPVRTATRQGVLSVGPAKVPAGCRAAHDGPSRVPCALPGPSIRAF